MTGNLPVTRDKALLYIQAILIQGYTKKDAYLAHINPDERNPFAKIKTMESKKEYQDLLAVVRSDDNFRIDIKAQEVRGKYLGLIEQNIDTAAEMLTEVKKDSDIKMKGQVVRLVNETITALAVVSGGTPAKQPGNVPKLDRSGVVS